MHDESAGTAEDTAQAMLQIVPRMNRWAESRALQPDKGGDLSLRQLSALCGDRGRNYHPRRRGPAVDGHAGGRDRVDRPARAARLRAAGQRRHRPAPGSPGADRRRSRGQRVSSKITWCGRSPNAWRAQPDEIHDSNAVWTVLARMTADLESRRRPHRNSRASRFRLPNATSWIDSHGRAQVPCRGPLCPWRRPVSGVSARVSHWGVNPASRSRLHGNVASCSSIPVSRQRRSRVQSSTDLDARSLRVVNGRRSSSRTAASSGVTITARRSRTRRKPPCPLRASCCSTSPGNARTRLRRQECQDLAYLEPGPKGTRQPSPRSADRWRRDPDVQQSANAESDQTRNGVGSRSSISPTARRRSPCPAVDASSARERLRRSRPHVPRPST